MKNAGHPDLIGVPGNYVVLVGSGAGGDVTVDMVVPVGQIWIVKYLTAYHLDGAAARTIIWYLKDPILPANIQGPFAAVASGIRFPFPFATHVPGPFVCSSGGFNIGVVVTGVAAGVNCVLEAHVHKVFGVSPLV
jgi:hypothetical protein